MIFVTLQTKKLDMWIGKKKAIRTLRDSLYPVSEELNEQDWKSG